MPLEAVSGLVGAAAFALVLGLTLYARSAPERSAVELLRDEPTGAVVARREGALVRRLLPPAPGALVARADLKAIDAQLANAGRPYSFTAVEFIRFKTLVAVVAGVLVALLFLESAAIVWLLAGIGAAAGGYRLPDLWLSSRVGQVARAIDRALPNVLDSLVLALDAGMDLEAALRRVVPKLRGAIREELDQVMAELDAGFSLAQSLGRLQSRARSEELGDLVALVQQSRRLGVGLSGALRQRAEEMRTRRRLRASEAAQRAPLKMTIPLVLFFLPALMLIFLGPALLSFLQGT